MRLRSFVKGSNELFRLRSHMMRARIITTALQRSTYYILYYVNGYIISCVFVRYAYILCSVQYSLVVAQWLGIGLPHNVRSIIQYTSEDVFVKCTVER